MYGLCPNRDKTTYLTAVIYPSRQYAERVQEADVLTFEESRAPLKKRNELRARTQELRRDFPPSAVSFIRLKNT